MKIPYQFAAAEQEDTYMMAVRLYLDDLVERARDDKDFRKLIVQDSIEAMKWELAHRTSTGETR